MPDPDTSPIDPATDPTDPQPDPGTESVLSRADRDLEEPVEELVPPAGEYSAKAGSYYRNVRYVIFIAALALGAYFLYDGYIRYPAQNERYNELLAEQKELQEAGRESEAAEVRRELDNYTHHSDTDILVQKVLGYGLPPVAILLMLRWWYRSRGRIRLDSSDTLHVPGRDPIPLSAIKGLDDTSWDRKGIAYVDYTTADGTGRVKLDDFVYERGPIDKIHDRLRHLLDQKASAT